MSDCTISGCQGNPDYRDSDYTCSVCIMEFCKSMTEDMLTEMYLTAVDYTRNNPKVRWEIIYEKIGLEYMEGLDNDDYRDVYLEEMFRRTNEMINIRRKLGD